MRKSLHYYITLIDVTSVERNNILKKFLWETQQVLLIIKICEFLRIFQWKIIIQRERVR